MSLKSEYDIHSSSVLAGPETPVRFDGIFKTRTDFLLSPSALKKASNVFDRWPAATPNLLGLNTIKNSN